MSILRVPRIPATLAARFTIWCFGFYAIWQGIGLVAGGTDRISGPAYTLMRTAPHAPITWGLWVLLAGVVILTASLTADWWSGAFWLKLAGLLMLVTWCSGFAVSALTAQVSIPTAGTTGGPTYLLIAFTAAIVIVIDEGKPHANP